LFFVNVLRDGAGMINREIGIARDMTRRGADVTMLSYFRPSIDPGEGVRVEKVWRTGYFGLLYDCLLIQPLALFLIAWKFLKLRPQIVLVDLHQEAWWALCLRPVFGYRIVFTYHGVADSRFYHGQAARELDRIRAVSHRLLKRVDRVVVVSDFLLDEAKTAGVEAARIHNGVERERFHPDIRFSNIQATGPVVMFIGRYTEYKGAMNVVEAFARALSKVPEAELVMHGFLESGGYIDSIKAFIEKEGIADRVRMLGPVGGSEMAYHISMATVFANGSVDETFCMPLLEAEACGVPCVAFAAGGIPEVVADGESGLLAPPGDVEVYAQNLARILGDNSLRERLAEGALRHAALFTYDRIGGQILERIAPMLLENQEG
jgi:glycosyltransferase involved in cell wall biosynthesis